jgi:hypothetical protein
MKFGFFHNGIGLDENEQSKFHTLINVDVRSSHGKVQCSKALADLDSSGHVASLPTCSIVLSNGDTFFGSGTKIIKVSSGVVTHVHTSTQGAVLGLGEHQGYLYYSTATKLGRITVTNASGQASWSSHNDSWATFSNQYAYKPMIWVNQLLCIGDGNYVALVDENGTFVANALDVLERDIITALHNMNDYLAIGSLVNTAVHQASFYNWDTYSPSWTEDYKIKERGVNMFFDIDGYTYAQAGAVGNLYQWTGERAVLFMPLRDADNVVETDVNPYGHTNLNGLTLIATKRGVYSIGRASAIMPMAMVIEYVSSEGQGAELGAIEAVGSDILLGFKNGSTYGIDHISNNYATGTIITPEADGKFKKLTVQYTKVPTNCSVTAEHKPDNSSFTSITMLKETEDRREYVSTTDMNNKSTEQAKIILNPSGATTPVIKVITLDK